LYLIGWRSNGDHRPIDDTSIPPYELIQDFNILLHVRYLNRFFGVENAERGCWCSILNEASTWLEKTAHEEQLEQCICILEEFESRASLD
jgi:hypothetical protein